MNYFIEITNEVINELRKDICIGIKEINYTNMNMFLRIGIVYYNKYNKKKKLVFYYNSCFTSDIDFLKNEFKDFLKYNLKGEVERYY